MYLQISLRNTGATDYSGVSGTITTNDPHVTVDDGQAYFGNLPAGGTVTNSMFDFKVSFDRSSPDYTAILALAVSDDAGNTLSKTFQLHVIAKLRDVYTDSQDTQVGNPVSIYAEFGYYDEGWHWRSTSAGVGSVEAEISSVDYEVSTSVVLYDDGTHGDVTAGDAVFTGTWTPMSSHDFRVAVKVADSYGWHTGVSDRMSCGFTTKPLDTDKKVLLIYDATYYGWRSLLDSYLTAFSGIGYSNYSVWHTFYRGRGFDSSRLNQFAGEGEVIIWVMPRGESLYLYNGAQVQNTIIDYLRSGGCLFVTGRHIAYYLSRCGGTTNTLLHDYFHADYVQVDAGTGSIEGANGEIMDGLSLTLWGAYPDEVDPVSPAVSIFQYLDGQVKSSGTAGLRVASGSYKVIYLAFDLDQTEDEDNRSAVLQRGLEWLGVDFTPRMALSATSLTFLMKPSDSDTDSRILEITNLGGGTLEWSAALSDSWLSVNPTSGTAPATLVIQVDKSDLMEGWHFGQVTIDWNGTGPQGVSATADGSEVVSVQLYIGEVHNIFLPIVGKSYYSGVNSLSIRRDMLK